MARLDESDSIFLNENDSEDVLDRTYLRDPESFRKCVMWRIREPLTFKISDYMNWLREGEKLFKGRPYFLRIQDDVLSRLHFKLSSYYEYLRKKEES